MIIDGFMQAMTLDATNGSICTADGCSILTCYRTYTVFGGSEAKLYVNGQLKASTTAYSWHLGPTPSIANYHRYNNYYFIFEAKFSEFAVSLVVIATIMYVT